MYIHQQNLPMETFQETLVAILEQAAECLVKGERYEVLGEVFKLIIPIYESAREFEVRESNF